MSSVSGVAGQAGEAVFMKSKPGSKERDPMGNSGGPADSTSRCRDDEGWIHVDALITRTSPRNTIRLC